LPIHEENQPMAPFQRVGILIRNTPPDEGVLVFAAHLAHLGVEEYVCMHAPCDDDDSQGLLDTKEVEAVVRAALASEAYQNTTCQVLQGDHIREVLRVARDQDLDLVIMGRRLPSSQIGMGSKIVRIIRKSPCSVLVVPELCRPHFGRILVAVDCSDYSKRVMETGIAIAKASPEASPQVLAVTVRHVTSRYDLAGVSFKESVEAQRGYGRKDLDAFLANIDAQGIPIEPLVLLSDAPALAISHAAMARKMDIVVAGGRGATATTATLLGSTSEELLMTCAAPLLIVKKKGETLRFLEALFST
jgi:nucleotide-binding universal stress UspA family protein